MTTFQENFELKERKAAVQDIAEFREQIARFKRGEENEERFKAYRLVRGTYGQRQLGVQMLRIKAPLGCLTPAQLRTLAKASTTYTNGNLHLTTRQSVQLHHVKVEDSPKIWDELSKVGLTLREACGNTVRNLTADPLAGIHPEEAFDFTPYAQALFSYLLRHPVGQDMGRKIKIAFSASEDDVSQVYFHDFGFIPKIQELDGKQKRGFQVFVGGGLGAQPILAQEAYSFLPVEKLLPFVEAALRVFDRYGERAKRAKARLKFLLQKRNLGLEGFLARVEKEIQALSQQEVFIEASRETWKYTSSEIQNYTLPATFNSAEFAEWRVSNVQAQRQSDFATVRLKPHLGNLSSKTAIALADLLEELQLNDLRTTIDQGLLIRFVPARILPLLFVKLHEIELTKLSVSKLADIVACPGTSTCNLAYTNSQGLATRLENVVRDQFEDLVNETKIRIKVSGCLNACGQHVAAGIGFQGITQRLGERIAPAQQLYLGGGTRPDGEGFLGEKIIKIPSRRATDALQILLEDYRENIDEGLYYQDYVRQKGKRYFFDLLQPLSDPKNFTDEDFTDWDDDRQYVAEVGVGECAGVAYDLISTIIGDARHQLQRATNEDVDLPSRAYHAYNTFVIGAKALLLSIDVACNSQIKILKDFDTHFISRSFTSPQSPETLEETALQLSQNRPEAAFVDSFVAQAKYFLSEVEKFRFAQISNNESTENKLVVGHYYKA